jgi:hypothetical protein
LAVREIIDIILMSLSLFVPCPLAHGAVGWGTVVILILILEPVIEAIVVGQ